MLDEPHHRSATCPGARCLGGAVAITPGLTVCFVFTPQSVSSYSLAGPTLWYRDHSAASTRGERPATFLACATEATAPVVFVSKSRVSSSSSPATGVNARSM